MADFFDNEGDEPLAEIAASEPEEDYEAILERGRAVQISEIRELIAAKLPLALRWVHYSDLKPCERLAVPIATQQYLIDAIKAGEFDGKSVMFGGPAGTGKTVLCAALYTRAVERYCLRAIEECEDENPDYFADVPEDWPIWRVHADEYLYRCQDYETGRTRERPVPSSSVVVDWARKDTATCLFLEEIDKFKASEFRIFTLFDLINAVMENGGCIVSSTNMTEEQFRAKYPDYLFRRLVETQGVSRYVDLFSCAGRAA